MTTENKRTIITAVRKIAFAGITLSAVWLILLAFRGIIPSTFVVEHNVPAGYAGLEAITVGSDGDVWFTETYGNQIGKISPTNSKISTYNVAGDGINASSDGIVAGPDGNLWFTEIYSNKIAKISPITDNITEYNVPTANAEPTDIVRGSDGNLWFVEEQGNKIGKISPEKGMITEYSVPTSNAFPDNITASPDGNLWFTEFYANKIGDISLATGAVTEYNIPIANAGPTGIAVGPDGNLWFTESAISKIGEISPKTGIITEYNIPVANAGPTGITIGPDGNLWFTEEIGNIGEISPKTGVITEYNVTNISLTATGLPAITSGPDGNLWFTEFQGNISKISPTSGKINEYNVPLSHDTITWNWGKSLLENTTVSAMIGQNSGITLRIIALIALMSLFIAGVLLTLGVFIGNLIKRPDWLVKARGVLRLFLVSCGASIPVFVISAFITIFILKHESPPTPPIPVFWSAFFCSLMPALLLVQSGYRMLSNRAENIISLHLVQQVSIRLFIGSLKLVGLIIVTTIMAGWFLTQQGLGSLLVNRVNNWDFPVIFGIVWVLVIIVVMVKLAAELIEIAYNHFTRQTTLIETVSEKPVVKNIIPKGWLIFSLGLCAFILLVAIFGPLLAHNGSQINLQNILQAPSSHYLLGTDMLGRDFLSRLLAGIRTELLIGLVAAGVVSIVAIGWAMLAARCKRMNNWRGDILEDIVLLPRDIICAVPWLVLLLLVISLTGNKGVILITLVVGVVILPRTVSLLQEAFGSLTECKGRLQNVLKAISIAFIFTTAGVMVYVALLSFLGFGVRPGTIELGTLASAGTAFMQKTPWLVIEPLVVLSVILIVGVMTGEALAERFGFRSLAFWSKTME